MEKRGQVTLFVVIGIVLLLTFALFFYARDQYGITVPTAQYLTSQVLPIQQNIQTCITENFAPGARLLGEQGGSFNPSQSVRYQSKDVKIVCANIPNSEQCLNLLQPFSIIELELQKYLQFKIDNCVDRTLATKKGYTTEGTKDILVNVSARDTSLNVLVAYDLTLIKDEQRVRIPTVAHTMHDAPLQELYNVAVDIVNGEAATGDFNTLNYMLQNRGAHVIQTDKPFPHTIYKITKKNSNYNYWIAIEGTA